MRKIGLILLIAVLMGFMFIGCNSTPSYDEEPEVYEYDPDVPELPSYYYGGSIPEWIMGNWDYIVTGKSEKIRDGFVITDKKITMKKEGSDEYSVVYDGDDSYYKENYTLGNRGTILYVTSIAIPRTAYEFVKYTDGSVAVSERIGDTGEYKCYDLSRYSEEENTVLLPEDTWWTCQSDENRISKTEVRTITFQKAKPSGNIVKEWEADENLTGTIMVYVTGTSGSYDVYIVGETITANKFSAMMFGRANYEDPAFENLVKINFGHLDTSSVTRMNDMFSGCSSLTSIDLSTLTTKKVVSMSGMFENCSSLKTVDISTFDITSLSSINGMFFGCSSLTDIDLSVFRTKQLWQIDCLFYGCSSLKSIDLSAIDTINITEMPELFRDCSSLESLDLSGFNTSEVTTMYGMFSGCTSLRSLNISSFDTSKVTNMGYMFEKCKNLENFNLKNLDTSAATNMAGMFAGTETDTIDLSTFDTSNVTDMAIMFMDSTVSNLVLPFDTSSVNDMIFMFWNTRNMKNLDISSFNTSAVTDNYYMFKDCGDVGTEVKIDAAYKTFYDTTELADWTYANGVYTRNTEPTPETKSMRMMLDSMYLPKRHSWKEVTRDKK